MSEKARRWSIETCPRCGSLIGKEGGWDGEYIVCTNLSCDAYGPHAENPEPVKGVEVAEVSALRKEWEEEVGLTAEELEALVGRDGYIFEPPEECDCGFRPPSECPNQDCADRFVESAWYKLRRRLTAIKQESDRG